ncbi:MAG: histidine phosphatase family protein [Anaerolineae bacterium]|nr:histidine phosphatase family protein [Anaerolineae bacterium]
MCISFGTPNGQPESPGDGPLESGITSAGVEQARLVADRLAGLPVTTIYCSPLRRAAETADIIALRQRAARRVVLPALAECSPVIPRGFESAFATVTPAEFALKPAGPTRHYARRFKFQPSRRGHP